MSTLHDENFRHPETIFYDHFIMIKNVEKVFNCHSTRQSSKKSLAQQNERESERGKCVWCIGLCDHYHEFATSGTRHSRGCPSLRLNRGDLV